MRHPLLRVSVALITFFVGLTGAAVWDYFTTSVPQRQVTSGSVAPIRLSCVEHRLIDRQSGAVHFKVVNVSGKQIRAYTLRYTAPGQEELEGRVTKPIYALMPGQTIIDNFSYHFASGLEDKLTLVVEAVNFADGTRWEPSR